MIFWSTCLVFYGLIALFAVIMSHHEQKETGVRTPLFQLLSYGLCILWPLTILWIMALVAMQSPRAFATEVAKQPLALGNSA